MISGALMLDENKEFSLGKLYKTRIPKLLGLLFFWSAVYTVLYQVLYPLLQGESISGKGILEGFLFGYDHLWYLYMQIGLYIVLPFLRAFVTKKNSKLVLIYILFAVAVRFSSPLVHMLSVVWEPANYIIRFIGMFHLDFLSGYVTYYLLGWYIVHIGIERSMRIAWYIVAVAAVVSNISYVLITGKYGNAYSDISALVLIYSSGIFLLLNSVICNTGDKESKIVLGVSKYSFGMYAVHMIFLDVIQKIMPHVLPIYIWLIVCWILTFAMSLFSTVVISKIPLVKHLVRA